MIKKQSVHERKKQVKKKQHQKKQNHKTRIQLIAMTMHHHFDEVNVSKINKKKATNQKTTTQSKNNNNNNKDNNNDNTCNTSDSNPTIDHSELIKCKRCTNVFHKKCILENENDNVDDKWRCVDCDACDSGDILVPELTESDAYCCGDHDQSHDKCESDSKIEENKDNSNDDSPVDNVNSNADSDSDDQKLSEGIDSASEHESDDDVIQDMARENFVPAFATAQDVSVVTNANGRAITVHQCGLLLANAADCPANKAKSNSL